MWADLNQQARTNFGVAAQAVRGMTPQKAFWMSAPSAGTRTLATQASFTQKGELIPCAAGFGASTALNPVLTRATVFGATRMAAAMGLSIPFVGPLAAIAVLYPDTLLTRGVASGIRAMTEMGREIRHLEFGGNYRDSDSAEGLRMQAVYEMSGSTGAARRFLGQEARFLHR